LSADTPGAASDQEPLAELELRRHRDLVGRQHEHWGGRAVTAVLVVFVVLALANQFGQQPSTSRASGRSAQMTVSTPSRVRGGLIFQTRIDVTAAQRIAQPALILSGGWFDGMTLNSVQPPPASQSPVGSGLSLIYPRLPAGRTMTVWLEWSVNPTNLAWDRTEQIELTDHATPLLSIRRSVTVFP
jgi:hypothetical protein